MGLAPSQLPSCIAIFEGNPPDSGLNTKHAVKQAYGNTGLPENVYTLGLERNSSVLPTTCLFENNPTPMHCGAWGKLPAI